MYSKFCNTIVGITLVLVCRLVTDATASERVVVQEGDKATLQFEISWPSRSSSNAHPPIPYFTLRFESIQRPFCVDGMTDLQGLLHRNQYERFNVVREKNDSSLVVNLVIRDVHVYDGGSYVFTFILYGSGYDFVTTNIIKSLIVTVPPGSAECLKLKSHEGTTWLAVHCNATAGNGDSTISCFQGNTTVPYKNEVVNNGIFIQGTFWFMQHEYLYCCSHNRNHDITQDSCLDFVLSPVTMVTATTTLTKPNFVEGGTTMSQRNQTVYMVVEGSRDDRSSGTSDRSVGCAFHIICIVFQLIHNVMFYRGK